MPRSTKGDPQVPALESSIREHGQPSMAGIRPPLSAGFARDGETLHVVRGRQRLRCTSLQPFAFDFNWPETTAAGELRNLGNFRVQALRPASIKYSLEIETLTTVRAAGPSMVLVTLDACAGGPRPVISTDALVEPPGEQDPLLSALLGEHPLDWMRSLLHSVGSAVWTSLAQHARIWPSHLDRLLEPWRELSCGAEHALWRSAGDEPAFAELCAWAGRLAGGMPGAEIDRQVRESSRRDGWGYSPAAEWLEASAGLPVCLAGAPSASYRLQQAGQTLSRMLALGLTPGVLDALQAMAESGVARERLSAATVVHQREKAKHRDALERVGRRIYAKAEAALPGAAAADLARMIDSAGGRWPLAEAAFDLSVPGGGERAQAAMAGVVEAFSPSREGVVGFPSLLSLGCARPLVVTVSLPLVSYLRAPRMIASLAGGTIESLPGARIEVNQGHSRRHALSPGAQSVLRRTALAPFRATAREPGSAENELVCQDSFLAGDREPSLPVRRLLDWLDLPADLPQVPACASLRLSIPSGWSEIWHELPHSRDDAFLPIFAGISTHIQESLRRWLPHLLLRGRHSYANPSEALPVLAYASSAACCGKTKQTFARARTGAAGIRTALYSGNDEFKRTLEAVYGELKRADLHFYRYYSPAGWATMLSSIYQQRRAFIGLLAVDALLIEEILHLSDTARELRALCGSPRFASKMLLKAVEASHTGLAKRFRRLLPGSAAEILPAILWIEATAAACRAMGASAQVAAALTIQRDNGAEIRHNAAALGRF